MVSNDLFLKHWLAQLKDFLALFLFFFPIIYINILEWIANPKWLALFNGVNSVRLERWRDFYDGKPGTVRPSRSVVEDNDVARAGISFGYPHGVVLTEEHLILFSPCAVHPGISPPVEDVAALAGTSPRVRPRFFGSGAVIDDPNLIIVVSAD